MSYSIQGLALSIKYTPLQAGDLELHVWCVRGNSPEELAAAGREALPGSPFRLKCLAGRAHAAGSSVDRFRRLDRGLDPKETKLANAARLLAAGILRAGEIAVSDGGNGDGGGEGSSGGEEEPMRSPAEADNTASGGANRHEGDASFVGTDVTEVVASLVMAGEAIAVRPNIRDRLGNSTAAPAGALSVRLVTSRGTEHDMIPVIGSKGGLTTYDVNVEPEHKGWHEMHVQLSGSPIEGSPVRFRVVPGMPDVTRCRLELPTEPEMDGIKVRSVHH